jgi:hypothetical protein
MIGEERVVMSNRISLQIRLTILGVPCIGYGCHTLFLRFSNADKFGTLKAMQEHHGEGRWMSRTAALPRSTHNETQSFCTLDDRWRYSGSR